MNGLSANNIFNEKGAASVLVIFMLLVLVTLGAFAITAANANYKLNRRTLEWNSMYYELDGMGEELLASIDEKLQVAEETALEYTLSEAYTVLDHADIPTAMQSAIFTGYKNGDLTLGEIVNNIYMYYADILVEEMLLDLPDMQVYTSGNDAFVDYIFIEADINSDRLGSEHCGLKLSVLVEPIDYTMTVDGALAVRTNDNLRYKIEDWYEYQNPINDEPPAEEIWDGSF